jgi:hypothetical protein
MGVILRIFLTSVIVFLVGAVVCKYADDTNHEEAGMFGGLLIVLSCITAVASIIMGIWL